MELLKLVNDIRNERCHNRAKYCTNNIACPECNRYIQCAASCIKSCYFNQCHYKKTCNSPVKNSK